MDFRGANPIQAVSGDAQDVHRSRCGILHKPVGARLRHPLPVVSAIVRQPQPTEWHRKCENMSVIVDLMIWDVSFFF